MGHRLLILFLLVSSLFAIDKDVQAKIDKYVQEIQAEREGINEAGISGLVDPFYSAESYESDINAKKEQDDEALQQALQEELAVEEEVVKFSPKVQAVIQNKVKIDDEWYRVGDQVGEYNISRVDNSGVVFEGIGRFDIVSDENATKDFNIGFSKRVDE